ncbi:MAG: NAD(P)/FAD-dependent oxidoreductase [Eubacteriales bacterium]
MQTQQIKIFPKYLPPTEDETYDILIIGGSVCGLLTAYRLSSAGYEVCVAERSRISPLTATEKSGVIGAQTAIKSQQIIREPENALKTLQSICSTVGCRSFASRDLLLFSDSSVYAAEKEYRLRNFSGQDVGFITSETAKDMFSFDINAGVYVYSGAAVLDTEEFCDSLASYLSVNGCGLHEDTEIVCVTSNGKTKDFVCETDAGRKINCKKVIDCRNYAEKGFYTAHGYTQKKNVMLSLRTKPVENLRGWHENCVIRDFYRRPMTFSVNPDMSVSALWARYGVPTAHVPAFYAEYMLSYLEQTLRAMFFCTDGIVIDKKDCTAFASYSDAPVVGEDETMKGFLYAYCGGCGDIACALRGAKEAADIIDS